MGNERPRIGIADLDRDVAQPSPCLGQQVERRLVVWVEPLHVTHLDNETGGVAALGDRRSLAVGEAERLLAEHVQSGTEPGQHGIGVQRIGHRDQHRIQRKLEQIRQAGHRLHAVALGHHPSDVG